MDRLLESSGKIETDDLDWDAAAKAGLTPDERFVLTYFSDIESQTIVYLRDLLHLPSALQPEVTGFLSMWNYEEYFHGRALARLMEVCGHPMGAERLAKVREGSRYTEVLEDWLSRAAAKIFKNDFDTIPMAWGASQEITTLRGYEAIAAKTQNPVLRTLCERIAFQERRHFAWYYNTARERLLASRTARRLTRFALERFWSPVGVGVKTEAEMYRLLAYLFPGPAGMKVARDIDARISELPGQEGVALMVPFTERAMALQSAEPAQRAA